MGPEPTKFALNFPMFLLFPKFHFLARFAVPWSFLCVCRQQAKVLRTNVNTCTIGGSELPFLSGNPYNWPNQLSLIPPLILNALLLLLPFLSGCLSPLPVLCIELTQKTFIKIIDMTLSVQHPFNTPGCYLLWLEPTIIFTDGHQRFHTATPIAETGMWIHY